MNRVRIGCSYLNSIRGTERPQRTRTAKEPSKHRQNTASLLPSWTCPSSAPKQGSPSRPPSTEQRAHISRSAYVFRPLPHAVPPSLLWSLICRALSLPLDLFCYPILHVQATLSMEFSFGTMSAPTASLVRAFSQLGHPHQHYIEDEPKGESVHCKRGRSLSTPSLNTREWHQFRMLDATTPNLGPCDPTPSGRPRSASFNPSPVVTCVGPSLGDQDYEQMGCSWDHVVEITEPRESPAIIPDEQDVATKNQIIDSRPEHLVKRTPRNTAPLPLAGGLLGSLLKRRNASRCFFSVAELDVISSFGDLPDDGGYRRPSHHRIATD